MKPGENGSYSVPDFIVVCGMALGAGIGYVISSPLRGVSFLMSRCKKGARP